MPMQPAPRRPKRPRLPANTCANHRQPWTAQDLTALQNELENLRADAFCVERLAARFGRTPKAIRCALAELGIHLTTMTYLTLHDAAAILQVHESTLLYLIRRRAFIPNCAPHRRRAPYRFTEDELWRWMEQPASWHVWQPERLTDRVWRDYFTELRRDWLTADEAAALLAVCPSWVHYIRQAGYLAGVKTARRVWFARQEVQRVREQYLRDGAYRFPEPVRPRHA